MLWPLQPILAFDSVLVKVSTVKGGKLRKQLFHLCIRLLCKNHAEEYAHLSELESGIAYSSARGEYRDFTVFVDGVKLRPYVPPDV